MNYTIKFATLISLLLLFLGCSKDDSFELNQSEVLLHYDEGFVFNLQGASNVQWFSSDEFVGTIGENGNFSAKHIGETEVTAKSGSRTFTAIVRVEPYINDIIEPVQKYGVYSETIRNEETREFISEDASQVRFMGQGEREYRVCYNLRNGVVDNSVIVFTPKENLRDELSVFFGERYELIENTAERMTYINKEKTIGINIQATFAVGVHATWVPSSYTVPADNGK